MKRENRNGKHVDVYDLCANTFNQGSKMRLQIHVLFSGQSLGLRFSFKGIFIRN